MVSDFEMILRLILSAILGGAVGMEREVNNRPAGLRTHILISLGSALIMLISIDGFESGDPARLAAQVVAGVGFLGAGTIMKTGDNIQGLTTAASIWVCSGIGLAIGNGYYLGGLVSAAIVLITLKRLNILDGKINKKNIKELKIRAKNRPGLIGDIGVFLGSHNILIKDINTLCYDCESAETKREELMDIVFLISINYTPNIQYLFSKILQIEDVIDVTYDGEDLAYYYTID